ncbi:hypothetical protein ACO1O0_001149 [Amphichorda felina]
MPWPPSPPQRLQIPTEHIRRAHPEHYIPKLPATEDSFLLMINTPPSETRNTDSSPAPNARAFHDRRSYHPDDLSNPATPRRIEDFGHLQGTASAAAALAELGGINSERGSVERDHYPETNGHRIPRTSIELPPLHLATGDITSDPYSATKREILPSLLGRSPPGRSTTLPPLQRPIGASRPRKSSVTKRGREAQHRKKNSRGTAAEWLRRIQNEDRKPGIDGRPHSAEPSADFGSRWEDLIEAAGKAASITGDLDEDRTPTNNYQASPLQQALTPPSHTQDVIQPFPSVESAESGDNFHMGSQGLSDSSPTYSSQAIQIYCAMCGGISRLRNSYACTECICGLCQTCVEVLMQEHGARRKCPRCATIGGRFKPFQLDIR